MIDDPPVRRREMDAKLDAIDASKHRSPWPILAFVVVALGLIVFLFWANETFGASPTTDGERQAERVCLIEANHYYDENGVHLLDQVIFYEWDALQSRYQIRSWRLLKSPGQFPRPCDEGYEAVWREGATQRRVTAPAFRETWTQHDPELMERRWLPRDERRELFAGN